MVALADAVPLVVALSRPVSEAQPSQGGTAQLRNLRRIDEVPGVRARLAFLFWLCSAAEHLDMIVGMTTTVEHSDNLTHANEPAL